MDHFIYAHVLYAHSYLRWLILLFALLVLARSFGGWRGGRAWTPADERVQKMFSHSFDLQFVLGVLLYAWLSPITYVFFAAPGAGMRDSTLRFFGIEHLVGMLLAIAAVHIGRSRSRRVDGAARHRVTFVSTLVALLLILASIPWPALQHGRPLFRGF